MTWNEFQTANKGKYSKDELSKSWDKYKKENGIENEQSKYDAYVGQEFSFEKSGAKLKFLVGQVFLANKEKPLNTLCIKGFEPPSKETYIDRVPIGELACGTKINKDLYLLSYA